MGTVVGLEGCELLPTNSGGEGAETCEWPFMGLGHIPIVLWMPHN